jgi:hypothetical protein
MKSLSIVILSICFLFGLFAPVSALRWIESSNGLIPPTMEGGNTELEFADVNLDGNIDLLSIGDHGSPYVNTDEHGIMVWFGDGAGNWSVYQNGNFGYGGIAVGDVNNDGFPDVGYGMHHDYSSTDFGDQLIEVALGDGTGRNWTPWDDNLASAGEAWGMFGTDFADIDADGDLDLASVSFGAGSGIHVYSNNGDGTWTHVYGYNEGNCNLYVEFGDINGDGYPDIASCTQDSGIFINDGTGHFSVLVGGGISPPGWIGYEDIALGDVDNDGIDEVAIVPSSSRAEVWKLNPDGQTWTDISGNLVNYGSVSMVDLADMNGDGFLDVISYGEGRVRLFAGDGGYNWVQGFTFTMPSPGYAKAFRAGADIDHNGCGDIAAINAERVSWIENRNHCRVFKEQSTPNRLTVVPVYPHGNEILLGGAAGWIEWLSAVPPGESTVVDIEFSRSGPMGPYELIASDLPNNGSYQLQWPDVNAANCYFRLAVRGNTAASAVTPAGFEIRSDATPDVSVEMVPDDPPVNVPAGGYFTFTGSLTNNTGSNMTVDVVIMLDVPGYGFYGPLDVIQNVPLQPYQNISVPGIRQDIPAFAPLGDYRYFAYCGELPAAVIDESYFDFTVIAPQNGTAGDWSLHGWNIDEAGIAGQYFISSNYPNPFNAATEIRYTLTAEADVRIDIYNISGQLVETLLDARQPAGEKSVVWNASSYSSGIYFYKISAGDQICTWRMTLLK